MYGVAALLNAETSTPSSDERTARGALVEDVANLLQSAGAGYSTAVAAVNVLKTALQGGRASAASASTALTALASVSQTLSASTFVLNDDIIESFVSATASAWNTVLVSDKASASRGVESMLSVGGMLLAGNPGAGYVNDLKSTSASFVAARGSTSYFTKGLKSLSVSGVRLSLTEGFKAPQYRGL